jgi:threonylcarbamoyladenosine tRNA methylthiotransferase MtaB
MRRRYDVALARERLAMIRELLPDAAIGTDLIAGFPGEDEAAFERTLAFLEESPITYAHVFPYSVRSGTTAAKLDGQVPPAVIAERARRLRAAGERKRAAFAHRFDGALAEVLGETTRDPRSGCLAATPELPPRASGGARRVAPAPPVHLAVGAGGRVAARPRVAA